jgi:hypothetical protein
MMTVEFVEAVSKKDKALQTAIRAFAIIRFGGKLNANEAKLMCDVLSLALPMKYRFPRFAWVAMEAGVRQRLAEDDGRVS